MVQKPLAIYQFSDGYCYNTDSLILAHFAKDFLKPHHRVLDIGAGSGILGLLCARDTPISLEMVELDPKTCILAQINAQNTDFAKEAIIHNQNIFDFQTQGLFDVIISNPPFYNANIIKSPNKRKNLARIQDSMPLDKLTKYTKRLLKPRGNLVMCYDARECYNLLSSLKNAGLFLQNMRFVYPLSDKSATLVLIQAKIDYRGDVNVLPPLFTHNSPNQQDNTKELQAIYQWAKTFSIKVCSDDV